MKRLLLLFILFSNVLIGQEICDNGIDDDGNGLIDLNDTACDCEGFGVPQNIPSLIPNPSFEDRNCCPSSFSQLSCADTWIQATTATSDYFNCGYNLPAFNNAGLTPPDGGAYVGAIYSDGWKEYIGSCLISPLLAGETYTLSFQIASFGITGMGGACTKTYGDVDVSIFGAANCGSLPVNTTNCPSSSDPSWMLIGSQTYTPMGAWGVITIDITPATDINAIMIGPPCGPLPGDYGGGCYAYFVYDNLILASNNFFNTITLEETGSFCTNDVTLTAEADSVGGTWQWYYEGVALVGETDSILNISANGLQAGEYNLRYTIGARCERVDYVVDPPVYPTALFDFNIVCEGDVTQFSDLSVPGDYPIYDWEWDFDQDMMDDATIQNPSHIIPTSGGNDIRLRVTDSIGCEHDTLLSVFVNPNPSVDFNWDDECLGDTTFLVNQSSISIGQIDSWNWDFDDGNTATLFSPSHVYAASGNYNVQLTAVSDSGCVNDTVHSVEVFINPIADFNFTNVCDEQSMLIESTALANGGTIADYFWDITSDGSVDYFVDSFNHVFPSDGFYDVTHIVETSNGCRDTLMQQVTVYALPEAQFTVDAVCEDTTTTFVNQSNIVPVDADAIVDYAWSFGNGNTSNIENPTHNYNVENVYDAQLVITTNYGCKDSITHPVEVYPLPVPDFTPTNVCLEDVNEFFDLSTVSNDHTTNNVVQWSWDFGDGSYSVQQNPINAYTADGTYNATLEVVTNNGCREEIKKTVTVHPLPVVSFSGVNLTGCSPICPEVSSTTTINSPSTLDQFEWTLSNGETHNGPVLNDCYNNPTGENIYYGLTLTVTSNEGCVRSHSENSYIEVYHNPVADFYYEPNDPDVIDPEVEFYNTSLYADYYNWTFGNQGSSTVTNPIFEFSPEPLEHRVRLISSTIEGCIDTAYAVVDVKDKIIFYVPNTFTPDQNKFNETFKPVFTHGFDPQNYTLYIFNRWGELVFESHDTDIGWYGTYGVEGRKIVKEGTYVWKIKFKETMSDKHHTHTGHVNLLR